MLLDTKCAFLALRMHQNDISNETSSLTPYPNFSTVLKPYKILTLLPLVK